MLCPADALPMPCRCPADALLSSRLIKAASGHQVLPIWVLAQEGNAINRLSRMGQPQWESSKRHADWHGQKTWKTLGLSDFSGFFFGNWKNIDCQEIWMDGYTYCTLIRIFRFQRNQLTNKFKVGEPGARQLSMNYLRWVAVIPSKPILNGIESTIFDLKSWWIHPKSSRSWDSKIWKKWAMISYSDMLLWYWNVNEKQTHQPSTFQGWFPCHFLAGSAAFARECPPQSPKQWPHFIMRNEQHGVAWCRCSISLKHRKFIEIRQLWWGCVTAKNDEDSHRNIPCHQKCGFKPQKEQEFSPTSSQPEIEEKIRTTKICGSFSEVMGKKKLQPFRIMIFLDPEISPKFQWPRLVNSHIFHHE